MTPQQIASLKHLKSLPKNQVIPVIQEVLGKLSDGEDIYAIAMICPPKHLDEDDVSYQEANVIGVPDAREYDFDVSAYDGGAQFGSCENCRIRLCCSWKHVCCPVCATPAYLT